MVAWQCDETAYEFFERVEQPPLPLPHGALHAGESLELLGADSTGKSALAMQCMLCCILPRNLGGIGARVVLFDADACFDTMQLRNAVRARFEADADTERDALEVCCVSSPSTTGPPVRSSAMLDAEVDECLERLLIFPAHAFSELISTLRGLSRLVPNAQGAPPLRLVVIDSISHFLDTRSARSDPQPHAQRCGEFEGLSREQQLAAVLGQLLSRRRLCAVWTRYKRNGAAADRFPQSDPQDALEALSSYSISLYRDGRDVTDAPSSIETIKHRARLRSAMGERLFTLSWCEEQIVWHRYEP